MNPKNTLPKALSEASDQTTANNTQETPGVNDRRRRNKKILIIVFCVVIFAIVIQLTILFAVLSQVNKNNIVQEYVADTAKFEVDQDGATSRYESMNNYLNSNFPPSKKDGPELLGNIYSTNWCLASAKLEKKCSYYEPDLSNPGQDIEVTRYEYSDGQKFGYGFSTNYVEGTNRIGMSFGYSEGGKTTMAQGLSMNYCMSNCSDYQSEEDESISLGDTLVYKTESGIDIAQVTNAKTVFEELSRYLSSEEDFLSYSLKREDQLQDKVEKAIKSNKITKQDNCELRSYYNPVKIIQIVEAALPPRCDTVLLNEQEKNNELNRSKAKIQKRKDFINRNYKEMYKLTVDKIFWDKCTDCWK